MPPTLRTPCALCGILLVAHALLAPFVATGLHAVPPIIVDGALLFLLYAFSRRWHNTLPWLRGYCGVAMVLIPILALLDEPVSFFQRLSHFLLIVETAACAILYLTLRSAAARIWFYARADL